MTALALNPLDASSLLQSFGALGVFVVLFAETGLLIGFFLPGDSLLVTAGLLAATGSTNRLHLNLASVLLAAVAGALLGAQTGYFIGRRTGPALGTGRSRRLREGVERSSALLARYGYGRALVLARFIPVVRTVLNPLAGVAGVPSRSFTLWNVVGGTIWAVGIVLAGYLLGSSVQGIDHYLLPVIAVIVGLSLLPILFEARRQRRNAGAWRA